MTNILYIHGAYSSKISFNFMNEAFPTHDKLLINYDCLINSFDKCVSRINDEANIYFSGNKFHIIGHSYGGIIGAHIAYENSNVEKLITLSSPFGGFTKAFFLSLCFPHISFFDEIKPNSKILYRIRSRRLKKPFLKVITTGGSVPWIIGPNDGVVPMNSQTCIYSSDTMIFEKLNHFEVLLDETVIANLKNFIFN